MILSRLGLVMLFIKIYGSNIPKEKKLKQYVIFLKSNIKITSVVLQDAY